MVAVIGQSHHHILSPAFSFDDRHETMELPLQIVKERSTYLSHGYGQQMNRFRFNSKRQAGATKTFGIHPEVTPANSIACRLLPKLQV